MSEMEPRNAAQVEGEDAARADAPQDGGASAAQDGAAGTEGPGAAPAAKKAGARKAPIAIAVAVVVLAAAGAGFFVWHEQPSFCAAICHTPMDAYYKTYADGEHDKYGNAMPDAAAKGAMMGYLHGQNDVTCMGCHVPTLSEQVSEGVHWITGGYEALGANSQGDTILEERSLERLTAARGATPDEFCLNEACHTASDGSVMTREGLQELTADLSDTRNPHDPHHAQFDCGTCHKAHSRSVNLCADCHDDAPVPAGWLTPDEALRSAGLN